MSNIIWLLFLDSCYILEEFFADIDIPFDREFIVVLQIDGHTILTELYRVCPKYPLQSHLFGNWTAESGLSVSTVGFYKRRNNLQGLVMKTGTLRVRTVRLFVRLKGRPRQATDVLQPAGLLYRPLWMFQLWPPDATAPTDAFRTLAAEVGTDGRGIGPLI
jgi:hypothetical protein